jgi:hypothetical protein
MQGLLAHSIGNCIALGPRAGRKVFTPQSLPAGDEGSGSGAGPVGGFSLDTSVRIEGRDCTGLERRLARQPAPPMPEAADARSRAPSGRCCWRVSSRLCPCAAHCAGPKCG